MIPISMRTNLLDACLFIEDAETIYAKYAP